MFKRRRKDEYGRIDYAKDKQKAQLSGNLVKNYYWWRRVSFVCLFVYDFYATIF